MCEARLVIIDSFKFSINRQHIEKTINVLLLNLCRELGRIRCKYMKLTFYLILNAMFTCLMLRNFTDILLKRY